MSALDSSCQLQVSTLLPQKYSPTVPNEHGALEGVFRITLFVPAKGKIPPMSRPFSFVYVICMRQASVRNPASFVSGTNGTEEIRIKFGIWGILLKG
jgi:hypothetical protein